MYITSSYASSKCIVLTICTLYNAYDVCVFEMNIEHISYREEKIPGKYLYRIYTYMLYYALLCRNILILTFEEISEKVPKNSYNSFVGLVPL